MKTLRYLLIVIAVMAVLSVSAQSLAQEPQIGFQSTSSMVTSGSTLPQAAQSGVYTTYDVPGHSNKPGIRRSVVDDDIPKPSDNTDPDATPIGDGMLPLALLALVYGVLRVYRRRKRV